MARVSNGPTRHLALLVIHVGIRRPAVDGVHGEQVFVETKQHPLAR